MGILSICQGLEKCSLNNFMPDWLLSIHHDGSDKYVSSLYPRLGERVHIRIRVGSYAPVRQIYLRIAPDGEQAFIPMNQGRLEPPVRWWEADLPIDQPTVHYRFVLQAEDGIWFYTAGGATVYEPLDSTDFRILADYSSPAWLSQAVFYQIFPDRFANGEPANDPSPDEFEYRGFRPSTFRWGTQPPADQLFPLVFYGGDLQGILQRLDYLQDLGVNALYLNPIFTAHTNHKYDVVDYYHVDPHFGGDAALGELRQALDDRGMRYILDIVPNHAGFWHPWFQKARSDLAAPEAQFFTFNRHPDDYATWLGVQMLPKLNYRSPELRQRIYAGPEAVIRRWLRPPYSADGWRVDVANMLARQGATQMGSEVARGIRQAVKETRPDAYLIGENFFDATAQLQGDQWDGVMNYMGLIRPLQYWLRGYQQGAHGLKEPISSPSPWLTSAMEMTWRASRAAVPWAIALQQYNLVGSHDTPRILSELAGNQVLNRLAAIIQFTYPGVPGMYYGDEIGMLDAPGLGSRACMNWDEKTWDRQLQSFYRRLITLRRTSSILQRGGFQMLAVEEDSFAFQREGEKGRILVVANRRADPRPESPLPVTHGGIPDGSRFREYFSGDTCSVMNGSLMLAEQSQGASLWIEETN
jgi:alpha-glucosidase